MSCVYGQNIISGKITNAKNERLAGAIVTVKDLDQAKVLAYAVSNENGEYKLTVDYPDQHVFLGLSFLGYTKQSIAIDNKTGTFDFIMSVSSEELKEVTIKSAPIYKIADTINYDIEEFTSGRDRTIGDVLRKLPGIETLSDGQILYQGRPIKKYYINGLDMLEGKYKIANDNLPVDAVRSVQVIENDQPIKVLESLVYSDQASLNIKLKRFTTTGSAKIGLGAEPLLREINITPMTFHKNFQAIYSFQSNNTGKAVNRSLRGFYDQTVYDNFDYLSVQKGQTPPFTEHRWLDNSINLGSVNILKKLTENLELKGGISYYNDFQEMTGNVSSTIFTTDQEIHFTEVLKNRYSTDNLRGNIAVVKNTKRIYLKNRLDFEGEWKRDRGDLLKNNNEDVFQKYNTEPIGINNDFLINTFFGKQLIHIGSSIRYSEMPMTLSVKPGPFEKSLNQEKPYDQVLQHVNQNNLFTDNYVGFTKGIKRWTFAPSLGFSYKKSKLATNLITSENNNKNELGDDYRNNTQFTDYQSYLKLKTQYKFNDFKAELFLPFNFQIYRTENKSDGLSRQRLYIEPNLNLSYDPHPFWSFTGNLNHTKPLGGISELYTSYILTGYRQLQRYNGFVPQSSNISGAASLHYKNPLRSVFSNFSYNQTKRDRSFIYSTTMDSEGLSSIELIQLDNSSLSRYTDFDISKYFHSIKTTLKLGGSASFIEGDYLLNNEQSQLKTKNYSATVMADYNQISVLNIVYNGKLSFAENELAEVNTSNFTLQNHSLSINIHPKENHMLSLEADHFRSNSESQNIDQTFLDASYRLTYGEKKIDIELKCSNILNTSSYSTFQNLSYSFLQNTYLLRPRQFLLSAAFRF